MNARTYARAAAGLLSGCETPGGRGMRFHHKVRGMSDDFPPKAIAAGLAAGRAAIGAGIWLAPERTFEALGFEVRSRSPSGPGLAMARLAATRDLILAVAALRALDDPARLRDVSLAGAAADAGDAVAFGLALARRDGIDRAATRGVLAALAATAAGSWVVRRVG
jgi:hypothetical protein